MFANSGDVTQWATAQASPARGSVPGTPVWAKQRVARRRR